MTEINTKDVEVDYRRTVEQILGPVVEAGVPYSIVFGNHDNQSYYSGQVTDRDEMLAVWQSIGDCRTTDPAPEITGAGTCKVPIYSSNGTNLAFNLWMVDSGSYQDPLDTSSGYDNPHADQIAWMKANNDAEVNSLVFQHIPMPETYNLFVEDANGEKTYGDKKYRLELKEGVTGTAGEFPATIYAHDNTGEFAALKEMGNVLGVFNGHDHLNDFSGTYDGIRITSVPGMSYFNYGDEAIRGYGVIELDESDLSKFDYNTVKFSTLDAEAGGTTETTYDDYDVVEYSDLKENGNALGSEYTISGGHTFTYDATSPSKSAILKFRWTAGSKPGYQFSFDLGENGNIAYPFGTWIKRADQTAPNGAWHLKPNKSDLEVKLDTAISQGETFDIEMGRLKVLTGAPQYVGQYYVYLKVNGKLIQEGYTNTDENGGYMSGNADCQVSNVIRFGGWGNGGDDVISQYVEPVAEEYAPYDVITYNDLLNYDTLQPLAEEGMQLVKTDYSFKYNESEEASETHSMIFKVRWTMETYEYFQIHLGTYGGKNNFAYRLKNDGHWQDRALDAHVAVNKRLAAGEYYDLEVARLMVTAGQNAGKYYTYLKVDGEIIFEKYVAANDENTTKYLNNVVYLGFTNDQTCFISATPEPEVDPEEPVVPEVPSEPETETYDTADEITYNDLLLDGNKLGAEHTLSGGITFTYNATSPSYSAILKYRFIAGSKAGVQFSFDEGDNGNISNPFGVWIKRTDQVAPNGAWHLKPHDPNLQVPMTEALVNGKAYDIEFARLKVLTGENEGMYYLYLKVNGELIQEGYSSVDENGYYTSGNKTDCQLSNKIRFGCWGNGAEDKMTATPEPETFEAYDEISFDDLYEGSTSMSGKEMDGSHTYTYNATSDSYSMILKYRWTAGGDEMKFTTFLDDWVYPFCFAAKTPNQSGFGATAGPNGSWHLVPSKNSHIVDMSEPVAAGKTYDIELARLKVATGANKGKYYVYAKVNGELIKDYYYDGVSNGTYGSGTPLSNIIIISAPSGNKFSDIPVPETFEAYDEIGFNDLFIGNISMNGETKDDGNHTYTYNATSESYSSKFSFRWIPDSAEPGFTLYLDDWVFPFCFCAKYPGRTDFGAAAGENGAWHLVPSNGDHIVQMDEPVVAGEPYDIEIGRIKVKTGSNAGKYYVYAKVNGELIKDYYYDGVSNGTYGNGTALSNKIIIASAAGNKFTAIPFVEEYEAYDEIGFEDLKDANGNALESQKAMSGATTLTYDKTSATGSVIFKYRWKIGTVPKFQMSFEKTSDSAMAYMFGAWLSAPGEEADYPNGRMWLRPGYGPQVNLATALVAGSSHNVEFARLKVANGSNKGKYLVYIKIDDVLIAEEYVAANLVDAEGNYTSNPGSTALTLSNEIFFAYWGSEGNIITSYKEIGSNEHEGTLGDFDGDGVINAVDLSILRKILLGTQDTSEMPEGIGDFNNDGSVNLRDLVAMKKYLAPVNTYAKTGSLTLGMQEHLLEDATKTATYIADASATLGAESYRLSTPIHTLYYATGDNGVVAKEDNMNQFKDMVAQLKAKGIDEILYVTDSFILPYGYNDVEKNHNITVPDPVTDAENYVAWLNVNAAAFKALANEVPEINFFEPFNEINVTGTRLERYGVAWESTSEEQAAHKFTVKEKAAIMADLCWYISKAVKSVDSANQVTSPSVVVGSNVVIENNFLDEFYKAIESGNYPTNKDFGDTRIDNYFTIVNIHAYPDYTEDNAWIGNNFESRAQAEIAEWAGYINTAYDVVKAHNDGGSRVWITETGMSGRHSDGAVRDEDNVARIIELALQKLDGELTFVDTVIFYKVADISSDNGASPSETYFGLFYSGDDLDNDPYTAKPSAKTIYSYFNNGTTDYSALDALANRYA